MERRIKLFSRKLSRPEGACSGWPRLQANDFVVFLQFIFMCRSVVAQLLPVDQMHYAWLIVFLIAGLAALTFGGGLLCRGAVGLALRLRIRPVVVGLTVVSLATSSPELFTSIFASVTGNSGLVVGNIIGSNIANIGLILGVAALICPLTIKFRLIRRDVPLLIGATALFCVLSWNVLGRLEGGLLLGLCVLYFLAAVRKTANAVDDELERELEEEVRAEAGISLKKSLVLIAGGTVLLAAGAEMLVAASVETAVRLGVSEVLIGITVVAVGTSLPELSAAIAAAVMRQADICAGNLVGSNLFNLLLIGGSAALIRPIPMDPGLFLVELPALVFFTILLWPFFLTGRVVSRREGAILLVLYGLFIALTCLAQTGVLRIFPAG